ncbi:MAG: SH3 domain-containing protein [Stellaceae bacterium]
MNNNKRAIVGALCVLALLALASPGPATAADEDANLKVPRFVSLHSDKVNLRTGPGRQYPIEWVLTKKDMPVEIVAQFEHWRRIQTSDGTKGWVQEHMVAGKRTVIVNSGDVHPVYQLPDPASPVVARAAPGVVARLLECRGTLCRVEADNISGWMQRTDIWGVLPDETVP